VVYRTNRRDVLSALLVILLTLAALLGGYLLRRSVEGRTTTYTSPVGVAVSYPEGWSLDASEAAGGVVRVRDQAASGFPTTLELRWVAVDPEADTSVVLAAVVNNLAGARAPRVGSYKVLNLDVNERIRNLPGGKVSFIYVSNPQGVFQQSLPVVVLGDDYLLRKEGRVYVFGLQAAEENRAQALKQFESFVESARLP